jgi:hypothetical protein
MWEPFWQFQIGLYCTLVRLLPRNDKLLTGSADYFSEHKGSCCSQVSINLQGEVIGWNGYYDGHLTKRGLAIATYNGLTCRSKASLWTQPCQRCAVNISKGKLGTGRTFLRVWRKFRCDFIAWECKDTLWNCPKVNPDYSNYISGYWKTES